MITKFMLGIGVFALAMASAATSYRVTFFSLSNVAGTDVKAGEYRLEIKDGKAVLKQGSTVVEAAVRVETADKKFSDNSIKYEGSKVQEIRIGGTTTRLVFEDGASAKGDN
jgi:hypothetical protein